MSIRPSSYTHRRLDLLASLSYPFHDKGEHVSQTTRHAQLTLGAQPVYVLVATS